MKDLWPMMKNKLVSLPCLQLVVNSGKRLKRGWQSESFIFRVSQSFDLFMRSQLTSISSNSFNLLSQTFSALPIEVEEDSEVARREVEGECQVQDLVEDQIQPLELKRILSNQIDLFLQVTFVSDVEPKVITFKIVLRMK